MARVCARAGRAARPLELGEYAARDLDVVGRVVRRADKVRHHCAGHVGSGGVRWGQVVSGGVRWGQ
eukprot:7127569-Prymnesium_polylepis.1